MQATHEPLTIDAAVKAIKRHYSELERLQTIVDMQEEAKQRALRDLYAASYDRNEENEEAYILTAGRAYNEAERQRIEAAIALYDQKKQRPRAPEHAGGYPIIYYAAGDALCAECVHDWPEDLDGGEIYYEGPTETCQGCQKQIASAYGDPNDEPDMTPDPLTDAYNAAQATADALNVPVVLTRENAPQIAVWPAREEEAAEYMPAGDPLTPEPTAA